MRRNALIELAHWTRAQGVALAPSIDWPRLLEERTAAEVLQRALTLVPSAPDSLSDHEGWCAGHKP